MTDCFIKLNGKYGEGKFAIVDSDDYDELINFDWFCNNYGYAIRNILEDGKPRGVFMHRQIMDTPDDKITDHINGDILDNRKSNLRIVTHAENNMNRPGNSNSTSTYKGVYKNEKRNCYVVRIKGKYLGEFENETHAAKVYDYYALREFGEYAYLNFPDDVFEHYEKPKVSRRNSSGYIGVSWSKDKQKWHAYIRGLDGKRINIGRFVDKNDAARAYNQKAVELYGNSTHINEITDEGAGAFGSF